ncbi:MAG: MFS transporter [Deltaproteobacteria bacterium]|nr:MFS transporter [Deltaproteobacteria bacterium]
MFKKLGRNIFLLGALSLFNDMAADMITPLLPTFLMTLGAGTHFLGLMEGCANALSNILKLFSGYHSDRLQNPRQLTVWGYRLCAFTRPLMAIASPGIILAIRLTDRIGKGIRTSPRDQLLTLSAPKSHWGKAFGVQRAMDHTGALLGPLLATFLLSTFAISYSKLFLLASIPAILSILVISPLLQEPSFEKREEKKEKIFSTQGMNKSLKIYLVIIFFAALSSPSELFLILKIQELGLSPKHAPLAWLLLTAFSLIAALLGGALSDKIKPKYIISLGWFFFAVSFFGFSQSHTLKIAWIFLVLYGFQAGFVEAAERSIPSLIVQSQFRGTALGGYYFAYGMALLPASLVFGYLWTALGSQKAFLIYALLSFISALVMFFFKSNVEATQNVISTPLSSQN